MKKRQAANTLFAEQYAAEPELEMNVDAEYTKQALNDPAEVLPSQQSYSPPPYPMPSQKKSKAPVMSSVKSSEELLLEKEPINVRETGFWFWKRIIIPPNAYVVHTRMRKKAPVTIGMGISFRYNPYTDAYLVVPAAMQTIGVVANCISKEKQGINVLAYVQWQIDDFSIAYRKLDFSDSRDPLGIVNAQLSEQAEAAIKDKVSTMSVEEVLTDKAPVIEELTNRLKEVSEGGGPGEPGADDGLGIKIVTVQIREALVSSSRLWQDLQAPFRNEKMKASRISYLDTQNEIIRKELDSEKFTETKKAETRVEIEQIKQTKETEAHELRVNEESTRYILEQELLRKKIKLEVDTATHKKSLEVEEALQALSEEDRLEEEKVKSELNRMAIDLPLKEKKAELNRLVQEYADTLERMKQETQLAIQREENNLKIKFQEEENQLKINKLQNEAEVYRYELESKNLLNEKALMDQFIEQLPELAECMPEINDLKVFQTGGKEGTVETLSPFIAKMMAMAETLGVSLSKMADKDAS